MIDLYPVLLKVPSACNNNFEMLKILRDDYKGEVHVSTGMTTQNEIRHLIEFFEENGQAKDRLVVYSCTSGYPVPFKDISLLEIVRLKELYDGRVKEIGFSGHHLGIAIDVAAYTLGATWIERHFTKDRTWKGTDHAASLEVPGLQKMIRDLEHTHEALTFKQDEILEIEMVQRNKLKYRK
jgi:N-acetylneuraminate synthase